MSSTFVRNLTFQAEDLGKVSTLVLTFHCDTDGIYQKTFPLVWRAITCGKEGRYTMFTTYTNQFAFSKVQVEDGEIVDAGTYVRINNGETTTLTQTDDGFRFSDPEPGVHGYLEACNETGVVQDIAISIMIPGDSVPKPVLYFKDVEYYKTETCRGVTAITPILRAYITSNYQETATVQCGITTDPIWEQDLSDLPETTILTLKRDLATGRYTITQELSALE
ncbi:uncharacterized protein EDB91DRAFT_1081724 [Suillus paluster]|uniref:uncharacterized protein n=1 Tax=Suillus paluster TaxID=48578 RepID=UPI001B86D578|nr:uncharacterized protein EDB91DRAFT_1081724 [Suillus paluster]KAG1741439.1 hypothetical protein EDB91DRAFT_1081724 [Suillus paluster]